MNLLVQLKNKGIIEDVDDKNGEGKKILKINSTALLVFPFLYRYR